MILEVLLAWIAQIIIITYCETPPKGFNSISVGVVRPTDTLIFKRDLEKGRSYFSSAVGYFRYPRSGDSENKIIALRVYDHVSERGVCYTKVVIIEPYVEIAVTSNDRIHLTFEVYGQVGTVPDNGNCSRLNVPKPGAGQRMQNSEGRQGYTTEAGDNNQRMREAGVHNRLNSERQTRKQNRNFGG